MGSESTSKKGHPGGKHLRPYPWVAIFSFMIVAMLIILISYCLGALYPNFSFFDKISTLAGIRKSTSYHFYTGSAGGDYGSIGDAMNGKFPGGMDEIVNVRTTGGAENAMKLTTEKNAFGLIQEELIHLDEQLQKQIRIITPLFFERIHVFYNKESFGLGEKTVKLSATTDTAVLGVFCKPGLSINMGPAGSGTQVIASFIMTLVEKQIENRLKNRVPSCIQLTEPSVVSVEKICRVDPGPEPPPDILFLICADPLDRVKKILGTGKYGLMCIEPSFVVELNKEFNLRMRVSDFNGKYNAFENISTMATLTYVIASKSVRDRDVLRFLKKLDSKKDSIHRALLHPVDTNRTLPLDELGFYNSFKDDFENSQKLQAKEIVLLILSAITLFFPVFRSITGGIHIWRRWNINKQVDLIASLGKNGLNGNITSAANQLAELRENVINHYGNGRLNETHFKSLLKRIELYQEKQSEESFPAGNFRYIHQQSDANHEK